MPVATWRLWFVAAGGFLLIGIITGGLGPVAVFVAALSVVWLPFWYWFERPAELRRARKANGQCLRCGYDLKGNVSGVCPECGTDRVG